MGLKGCPAFLKWIVLVFNLIFWLAGMGVLALAIYLRLDFVQYAQGNPHLSTYNTGVYILMAAGGVMSLVGFFGCFGAYKESPCMLGTFFTLLLVVFAAEVAAGVWAFVNKGSIESIIEKGLEYAIDNYYKVNSVQTEAMDVIQREVRCCGVKGPSDWKDTKYGQNALGSAPNRVDIGVASSLGGYRVPPSCCSVPEDSADCDRAQRLHLTNPMVTNIHTKGCREALEAHVHDYINIIAGIGIGIAIVEILGMILSIVLCCAIRRDDTYKH